MDEDPQTEPKFTRAEYWVLETVVEWSCPLAFLDRPDIELQFNKPGHGLDRAGLIDTLERLFSAGLIEAGVSLDDAPCGPLARDGIIAALAEPGPRSDRPWTCYRLTPSGALQWEAFARPEWNRFVLDDSDDDTETVRLRCVDRQWLERYLAWSFIAEGPIEHGVATYEEIGPWDATYWKTLPDGWKAEFHRPQRERIPDSRLAMVTDWLTRAGFCDIRDGWYRWR